MYIFGGVNVLTILVVWALYPETNQRTLEEMNLIFACDSVWNWECEKHYAILKEENPDLVQAARKGSAVIDPETGLPEPRRGSSSARKSSLVPRRASQAGRDSGGEEKFSLAHKE